jgi:hypothetical protein
MYYYNTKVEAVDYDEALGKHCLLRQGLQALSTQITDPKLNQALAKFLSSDNYFFGAETSENHGYIASLWECAQTEISSDKATFISSVEKAYQNWQKNTDLVSAGGLFMQVMQTTKIPTITNSIIAGVLARAAIEGAQ